MGRVKDYYWHILEPEDDGGDEQWNHHTTSIVKAMYQNI